MTSIDLKHKPLIEAILEVRWALRPGGADAAPKQQGFPSPATQPPFDPNYKLLVGRFFDRVHGDYPVYEQLPTATVPDEMVPFLAQHRFRVAEGGWPLTQLGPGVLTLNATEDYTWSDFRERSTRLLEALFDAYPDTDEPKVTTVSLRYIDAVAFDYTADSVFAFLAEKMRVHLSLPEPLFRDSNVDAKPSNLNWQASFHCRRPDGEVLLQFQTGQRDGRPALYWNTIVASGTAQAPAHLEDFTQWLEDAHHITHDWFFKLIEGDLERRFRGE